MELVLDHHQHGRYVVVDVTGDVDVASAPRLRAYLADVIDGGQYQLVVSLVGVEFIDSTGLGVLVGALRGVRQHDGHLTLVCPSESLRKVLRITGLDRVFDVVLSVHDLDADSAGSADLA